MKKNPSVNILICNHNYSEWIVDCINSAIKQDYENISITFVDDGSTDDSWDMVLNEFLSNHTKILPCDVDIRESVCGDKNIKITAIRLDKNYGPSFARNIGLRYQIEKNKPDYFLILDADDEIYPNKVSKLLEYATEPFIGVLYADYHTLDSKTKLFSTEIKSKFAIETLYERCIVHSGSLISTESLLSVYENDSFYDNSLRVCEDYDLWLRISEKYAVIHVPEILSIVRVTPVNSTNTVKKEIWQRDYTKVMQKATSRHAK